MLTSTLDNAVDNNAAHVLWDQGALFIYRSLECLSQTVAGAHRDAQDFSMQAKALARTISLVLRCRELIPADLHVLPSTEAICATLFHTAVCRRDMFWPALAFAWQRCFAPLQKKGIPSAHAEMYSLFVRAIEEYGGSQESVLEDELPSNLEARLAVQLVELGRKMWGEALQFVSGDELLSY